MDGAAGEPVRRTAEIEDVTNLYFIHPIAARLVPLFARWHVPPNAVSLAGMLFGMLAGFAYYRYRNPLWAAAGLLLMIAWHVMDGADGQLARLTHKQSDLGKVLDGICDYVTFIAVYFGLALAASRQDGLFVWPLVIVSGGFHAVQSAAYEVQRQAYDRWNRFGAAPAGTATRGTAGRLPDLLHAAYENVQRLTVGATLRFHEELATLLRRRPETAAFLRRRYVEIFAPEIRRWSILSANYRTLFIFIAALPRAPMLYFCFEIVGFSAILVLLLFRLRAKYALFLGGIHV